MHEDALPRLKAAVLEQSLPRGQARDRQARADREVDVAGQRREVACLDGHILRQGAVAIPRSPVQLPLKYQLVINLKTAKSLRLEILATPAARGRVDRMTVLGTNRTNRPDRGCPLIGVDRKRLAESPNGVSTPSGSK